MKAEILSIGTEILLGEIVDTNAQYIASRLPALGVDLYFKAVVGDNMDRLTETIGRARERSDIVICTGGLGPTEDDLTREAISAVLGEEPHVDPELEATLRGFFERRGYAMPERNVKQCWVIPSSRVLPNPRGTAPGWWVERDGKVIVAMPGPPTEMTRVSCAVFVPSKLLKSAITDASEEPRFCAMTVQYQPRATAATRGKNTLVDPAVRPS